MRIKVALAVLLACFGAWALEAHARTGTQRTLGAVATELAGRPVSVRCQSLWADLFSVHGETGNVRYRANGAPPDSTWLTRETCRRLHRFLSTHGSDLECLKAVDWSRFAWSAPHDGCVERAAPVGEAVVTLAHESMHLRGVESESAAQCLAERATPRTVALLGGDPATGEPLRRLARAWNGSMPSEYQGACPDA